jgi:Fe-S cluster assembly protein SufD
MINQLETPLYESLVSKFEIALLQGNDDRSRTLRQEAFQTFKTLGFPSIKNEEWKYTNVLPFLKDNYIAENTPVASGTGYFQQAAKLVSAHLEAVQNSLKGEHKGAYRLVTLNGLIVPELSVLPSSSEIRVLPLSEATDQPSFEQHFGHIARWEDNAFVALNTAMYSDGLFIEVGKNTIPDKPLHIVNVLLSDTPVFVQPRHLFVVNAGAQLEIIETTISDDTTIPVFVNGVTEIAVATGAHFHHYDIQTGRNGMRFVQRTEATQERHSNYSNYTFTLPGADLVRNNLVLHLNEADLESHLYGLYLSAGTQLIDNHTEVHHKMPRGESNQLYKGVLLDKSKAVFNGKIYVYEDAQKTNAFQQSNNILFSDKSTVNAKPQLEIFADDVKCSHGTTIGQINKDALFYLQSRGISEATAKNLMVNAFAFDVTQKVKIPALRTYLEQLIAVEMEKA